MRNINKSLTNAESLETVILRLIKEVSIVCYTQKLINKNINDIGGSKNVRKQKKI